MKNDCFYKVVKAQRDMQNEKESGVANSGLFISLPRQSSNEYPRVHVVISSDKDLCGGIHSSVSKAMPRALADTENPVDRSALSAQLSRTAPTNIALISDQIGRDISASANGSGLIVSESLSVPVFMVEIALVSPTLAVSSHSLVVAGFELQGL
jgi:F-type H+-transporting ATPase subunit gamma